MRSFSFFTNEAISVSPPQEFSRQNTIVSQYSSHLALPGNRNSTTIILPGSAFEGTLTFAS
jgi:hypothetical protein